jgi:hypothetical protein
MVYIRSGIVERGRRSGSRKEAVGTFFKSEQMQREFDAAGFVTMPVLNADEVAALARHCSEVVHGRRGSFPGLFISLMDEEDVSRRMAVAGEINRVVGTALSRTLHSFQVLIGAYLVKSAFGPHTAPHQDTGLIAHERIGQATTATVWIPLQEVDASRGALGIIRASHRFSARIIGMPPPAVRALTHGHEALLFKYLTFIPLRAGEAVIFDTRCIHGAMPNATPAPRMAATVRIVPSDEQLFQYFLKPGTTNRLLKLRVTEEVLIRYRVQDLYECYKRGSIPEQCEVVGEIQDDYPPWASEEIVSLCRLHGAVENGCSMDSAGASAPAP